MAEALGRPLQRAEGMDVHAGAAEVTAFLRSLWLELRHAAGMGLGRLALGVMPKDQSSLPFAMGLHLYVKLSTARLAEREREQARMLAAVGRYGVEL